MGFFPFSSSLSLFFDEPENVVPRGRRVYRGYKLAETPRFLLLRQFFSFLGAGSHFPPLPRFPRVSGFGLFGRVILFPSALPNQSVLLLLPLGLARFLRLVVRSASLPSRLFLRQKIT